MGIQNIDFGTGSPNDGEFLDTAFPKIQHNFEELYALLNPFIETGVGLEDTIPRFDAAGALTTSTAKILDNGSIESPGYVASIRDDSYGLVYTKRNAIPGADYVGGFEFWSLDDSSNEQIYAGIYGYALDDTTDALAGEIEFWVKYNNNLIGAVLIDGTKIAPYGDVPIALGDATVAFNGAFLKPTPDTATKGFHIEQTISTLDIGSAEGADSFGFSYNYILVSDGLGGDVGTAGTNNVYGLGVNLRTKANAEASRVALFGQSTIDAATTGATAGTFFSGLGGVVWAKSSLGGTNTGAGAKGSLFSGFYATIQDAAATNYFAHFGVEISTANAGTVAHRIGLALTDLGPADTTAGATTNTHISLGSLTGATRKTDGILLSSLHGQYGLAPAGTFIRGTAGTLAYGVDFTAITFTSYAFASPGFSVDPDGDTIAKSATLSNTALPLKATNTANSAAVQLARFDGDRASPTAADEGYLSLYMSNAAGTQIEYGRFGVYADDIVAGTEDGQLRWSIVVAGVMTNKLILGSGNLLPVGTLDLGLGVLPFRNLYLAGTGIIDFGNGDVQITGSTNALGFSGASSGYSFDADILLLAGKAINWASGGMKITEFSDLMLFQSATAYVFDAVTIVAIDDATTNDVTVAATLRHTTSGTPANNIGVGLNFEAETAANNNEILGCINVIALDTTAASEDGAMLFKVMVAGAAATTALRIDSPKSVTVGAVGSISVQSTSSLFQTQNDGTLFNQMALCNANDNTAPAIAGAKSRHATFGSHTVVQSGDPVLNVSGYGSDGTDYELVARIQFAVDATPGNNDMPGRITFWTTADGANTLSERMRIDNAGRVNIGLNGASFTVDGFPSRFTVSPSDPSAEWGMGQPCFGNNASAGSWFISKTRNSSPSGHTILQDGDRIFQLYCYGSDGTDFEPAALIQVDVDGTPGNDDMPGRMSFWTTPDGSSTLTEKMRIDQAGRVAIGGGGTTSAFLHVLQVGTATVAPFKLTSSGATLLTTPAAGAFEYDGTVAYFDYAASQRAVLGLRQFVTVQGSDVSLSNSSTSAQNIFASANDAITVLASTTYRFKFRIYIATGTTTHTTAFGIVGASGTATFTSARYTVKLWSLTSGTASTTAPTILDRTAMDSAVINATSTAPFTIIEAEGIFRVNGGGTIIPNITFSAGPTGTCAVKVDSYFEYWPIGSNTVAAVANAA